MNKNQFFRILKRCLTYSALIFLFSNSNILQSQIIEINALLDTNKIIIGEQTTLILSAKCAPNVSVEFPNLRSIIKDGIEILSLSKIDSINNNGSIRFTQKAIVTSFDSGLYTIPPIPVIFIYNHKIDTGYTQEKSLYVNNASTNSSKGIITNIRPIYKAPIKLIEILFLIFIIGILSLASFFGYRYLKKRKGNKPIFSFKKPPPPPHIIALSAFDKLKEEKLWQKGQVKLYYTKLTDILRIYLEGRYHIKTLEKTSYEILDNLTKSDFNDNKLFEQLKEILETSDIVKFAKGNPEPNENESSLLNAYSFVNNTKIIESAPPIENTGNERKKAEHDE